MAGPLLTQSRGGRPVSGSVRKSVDAEWRQLGDRLAAQDCRGDQLSGDWRQQYAVSEVTGRQQQVVNAARSEYGQMIRRVGSQTRPCFDYFTALQCRRQFYGGSEQRRNSSCRNSFLDPHILDR